MKDYVYHGSKVHGLTVLVPHKSTHGNYVYATKNKGIAAVMAQRCGDDATYTLNILKNGKLQIIERIPRAFEKMFSNSFSLYTLDGSLFKSINTGFDEVVSKNKVPILKEKSYKCLLNVIHKLEKDNLIYLFYYPDRPNSIPKDDSDLIKRIKKVYKTNETQYTERDLARWIFLHPNLENEIRNIAKDQGIIIPSYDKIKDLFIKSQKQKPDYEMYIDNALEMYEYCKLKGKL